MDVDDQVDGTTPGEASKYTLRDWLLAILAGAGAFALVVLVMYLLLMALVFTSFETPYDDRDPQRFTQAAWHAAEHDSDGARYMMLDDLLEKEPLVGRTRDEVEKLLGPIRPSTEYPWFDACYYLGPEPSAFSVDNIWLLIEFDANDRVTATSTATD